MHNHSFHLLRYDYLNQIMVSNATGDLHYQPFVVSVQIMQVVLHYSSIDFPSMPLVTGKFHA